MASSTSFVPEPGTGPLNAAMELEAVYTDRRQDIVRMLLRFGVREAEAEDVTQQVFLNAYDRGDTGRGSLFHWLSACARNLAVSRYRRSRKEHLAPAEQWKEWEETLADPGKSILTRIEETERYAMVTKAISELSLRQQECLLRRSKGHNYQQIAIALDISKDSAMYAVHSGIQKLRDTLNLKSRTP